VARSSTYSPRAWPISGAFGDGPKRHHCLVVMATAERGEAGNGDRGVRDRRIVVGFEVAAEPACCGALVAVRGLLRDQGREVERFD
jgi:hypothetical protein